MATRKDQLDAFVFARRRMVSNLVAPSPTGSDEAAPRPVRTFFTSAILSAVAVAGVAVLGVFKPGAPAGWQSGLAVDSTSGAAYVYSAGQLHPILNITSARLLLGEKFKKFDVPDSVINGPGMSVGAPYGIPGAPPDVPAPANVDLTQWNLCVSAKDPLNQATPGGRTVLEIGYDTQNAVALTPGSGFVVHDSLSRNYLIEGDYAYQITDNGVLGALAQYSVAPGQPAGPWVSSAWLSALRPGDPIGMPTVQDIAQLGNPLPPGLTGQPGKHIGDYGMGPDGTDGYIETDTGLVQVNDFVYRLYAANKKLANSRAQPLQLSAADITRANPVNEMADATSLHGTGATWPTQLVIIEDIDASLPGYQVLCVGYSGRFDRDVPQLTEYYSASVPHASDSGLLQSGGSAFADELYVRPGHAALSRAVTSGSSKDTGPLYLIPDTGTRYGLAPGTAASGGNGASSSALDQLQYRKLTPEPVPDNWVRLIQTGATLDPTVAGTTPSLTGQ